jgi:hypothetical protein
MQKATPQKVNLSHLRAARSLALANIGNILKVGANYSGKSALRPDRP